MSAPEVAVYSGLKLLPAALEVLDLAGFDEPAVAVRQITEELPGGSTITAPQATIDWALVLDGRRSSTETTLGEIARSLLDREPVDLGQLASLGPQTGRRLVGALAAAWDEG